MHQDLIALETDCQGWMDEQDEQGNYLHPLARDHFEKFLAHTSTMMELYKFLGAYRFLDLVYETAFIGE